MVPARADVSSIARPLSVLHEPRSEESRKLFTILCNYLSLSQFELARTVIDQLFQISPERVVRALRELVFGRFDPTWLTHSTVRSPAHLSWLALVEYRALHRRVSSPTAPPLPSTGDPSQDARVRSRWTALRGAMRPGAVNPLGFISHDVVSIVPCELQLPADGRTPQRFCRLFISCEGEHRSTRLAQMATPQPPAPPSCTWADTLPIRVRYADSTLSLRIMSYVRETDPSGAVCVGICSLPLAQVRGKTFYHMASTQTVFDSNARGPIGAAAARGRSEQRALGQTTHQGPVVGCPVQDGSHLPAQPGAIFRLKCARACACRSCFSTQPNESSFRPPL